MSFTRTQFESTASYASGELSGIGLGNNNLTGWSFAGKNLTNADFSGATLTDADFSGATIAGANFSARTGSGLGLTKAQFESTASYVSGELSGVGLECNDLTGWNFAGKNLTDAYFYCAILTAADLAGANLSNAVFYYATLTNADFSGSNLTNAHLYFATLNDTDFTAANLSNAYFYRATLTGAIFSGATISGTDFSLTTDSGFTKAQFESTASFACGELSGVGLECNDLTGWNFAGKNLANADFYGSTLTNADLAGANLSNACFCNATLIDANLAGADARGASSMLYSEALDTTNFIQPDGCVEGLNIASGGSFRVRDYDYGMGTITVGDGFSIDAKGTLIVELQDSWWNSTIAFDTDISLEFDGTLEVELRDGFVPEPGDEWRLFDFTGVTPTGEFHTFVLPNVLGGEWDASRLLSDGILSLTDLLPGDADLDGTVDADDAAALAANWLTAAGATRAQGDFNNDGRVDDLDAVILAANWQRTRPPSNSVPEPSAAVLLLFGSLACLGLRRRDSSLLSEAVIF